MTERILFSTKNNKRVQMTERIVSFTKIVKNYSDIIIEYRSFKV